MTNDLCSITACSPKSSDFSEVAGPYFLGHGCIRKLGPLYSETKRLTVDDSCIRKLAFGTTAWDSETDNWKLPICIQKLNSCIRKLDGCIRKLMFGNYKEQPTLFTEIINFSRNYPPMFFPPNPRHPTPIIFTEYEEHSF